MLGFKFKENFTLPYFSKDITEFWRRWHISLSSWLRDYLYISFGGNRKGKFKQYRNLMLTMLLGGLWHGASWNFVIWGGLNGFYLSVEKALNIPAHVANNYVYRAFRCLYVFVLICFTWIFFRANTFHQAITIIKKIFTEFDAKRFNVLDSNTFFSIIVAMVFLFTIEFVLIRKYSFDCLFEKNRGDVFLSSFSIFLLFYVILFGNSNGAQFIYFQF